MGTAISGSIWMPSMYMHGGGDAPVPKWRQFVAAGAGPKVDKVLKIKGSPDFA